MCTSADEEVNKSLPATIIQLVVRVGLVTQVHQTSSLVPSNHSATLQYNMALLYQQEVRYQKRHKSYRTWKDQHSKGFTSQLEVERQLVQVLTHCYTLYL